MRQTHYWHALLGGIIVLLVFAFPFGIVGGLLRLVAPWHKSP
jgi:branched-chain amino acid transport system permease protein